MMASVAQSLLAALSDHGLRHVFLVPGMQIDPLVKALARHKRLSLIVANHELAAGYMADGYARASGRPGAVCSIGGPGAANLLGAAITSRADRSPVLFVTGNIPEPAQGRGEFQDAGPSGSNDCAIFAAALGQSLICRRPADLSRTLANTFHQLEAGRSVHLAIAMDVQDRVVEFTEQPTGALPVPLEQPDLQAQSRPLPPPDWLVAGRVLLVAGGDGLAAARAINYAANTFYLAVASTGQTRGVVPEGGLHAAGHLGFMQHPRASAALDPQSPLHAQRVVAIGCDTHLAQRLKTQHPQVELATSSDFCAWVDRTPVLSSSTELDKRLQWLTALALVKRSASRVAGVGELPSYAQVVDAVSTHQPADAMFVIDAGQVRRVAMTRLQCQQPRTLFVAEGMAPMGWSLGAAIGAQLALPKRRVVAMLGDGGMRMHGIELATASRYQLPILYVLFDNAAYGSLMARMSDAAEKETARLPQVDWCTFARTLGVEAVHAADLASLRIALANSMDMRRPRLIVVSVPAVEPEACSGVTGIGWS